VAKIDGEANLRTDSETEGGEFDQVSLRAASSVGELAVVAAESSEYQHSAATGAAREVGIIASQVSGITRLAPTRKSSKNNVPTLGFDETEITTLYLNDVGEYKLLETKSEEARLAGLMTEAIEAQEMLADKSRVLSSTVRRRLKATVTQGLVAREELITSNLRLVASVAKRFLYSKVPYLDLIQHGNIGLMRAVDKFDASKGFKFSTYATWWIRQSIGRGIDKTSRTIRLPIDVLDYLRSVQKARMALAIELSRTPTVAEITQRTNLKREQVEDALLYEDGAISFDVPINDEGSHELKDLIPDANSTVPLEAIIDTENVEEARGMLCTLSVEENGILNLIYGLKGEEIKSIAEISRLKGINTSAVARIRDTSLGKLSHPSSLTFFNNIKEDDTNSWRNKASCLGAPTEFFFPASRETSDYGKEICAACPVREECLDYAIENKRHFGVWGGTDANRREKIRQGKSITVSTVKVSIKV